MSFHEHDKASHTLANKYSLHTMCAASREKSAFKYTQIQIQIILRMRKVSTGPLLAIQTFCSIQWLDTTERLNGELLENSEGPDQTCTDAQGDLCLRWPLIPEDTVCMAWPM